MAVKLRLRRMGKKKQPVYKVVAADARAPRDGKFLESIGVYNPMTNPATIEIKHERALYWLQVGAQPTDTVKNLLSKTGVLLKKELLTQGLTEEEATAKVAEWSKLNDAKRGSSMKEVKKAVKAEAPKAEAPKAEKPEAPETVKQEEATGTASDETPQA